MSDQYEPQRPQQQDRSGAGRSDFQPQNDHVSSNGDSSRQNGLGSSVLGSPSDSIPVPNGQQSHLAVREASGSSQQAPIGSGQPTPQSQPGTQQHTFDGQSPQLASNVKRWADMTDRERYGMAGLMARLEARRAVESGQQPDDTLPNLERNTAMLTGQSNSDSGLDLNSGDPLFQTFFPFPSRGPSDTAYDFRSQYTVPSFRLPPAYTVNNVPDIAERMPAFGDGKLYLQTLWNHY